MSAGAATSPARGSQINLRRLQRITTSRSSGLLLATVALLVVLVVSDPLYLSLANLEILGIQVSQIGIVAVGMAVLMISGNVDLSVGSMTGLVATATALLAVSNPMPLPIIFGLAIGMGCGLLNGLLVWRIPISPIIITVGFLSLYHGIALLLNHGAAVPNVPAEFSNFGQTTVFGFSISFAFLVVIGLLTWIFLATSVPGRHIYAIGGNRAAAARVGIPLRRFILATFAFNGLLVGLGAVLVASRYGTASPEFGVGLEIQAITAVILGGVSFSGGEGSMAGVMLAVIFLVVLQSAIIALGIDPYYADVIMGLALITAVALDQLTGERRERRRVALALEDSLAETQPGSAATPVTEANVPSRRSTP